MPLLIALAGFALVFLCALASIASGILLGVLEAAASHNPKPHRIARTRGRPDNPNVRYTQMSDAELQAFIKSITGGSP